ncbi:hypothetical protein CF327_g4263 [Tilletia walkeri]|uniref:Peroxin-3 n=1 Tax=Tilletia walkeri TaxID=117179 RepID=A0A8X7T5P3_9BASI|nr:hypothetical protein CF327_g4263 [Tilletia walkeri]KAE8269922.1 hypothetical protein A4X09_0g2409 [Tilletia walkeri]
MLGGQRRQRLNLVSDAPVPGPGSNLIPNRRWILSRQSPLAKALPPALTGAPPPAQRSYLAFFARAVTVVVVGVGATYAATKYAFARIADIQRGISSQRRDTENLRKRFAQNQEDCTFTVLALLPTLDAALAKKYDVDAITRELSAKPAQASAPQQQSEPTPESPAQPTTTTYAEAASSSVTADTTADVQNAEPASEPTAEPTPAPEAAIEESAVLVNAPEPETLQDTAADQKAAAESAAEPASDAPATEESAISVDAPEPTAEPLQGTSAEEKPEEQEAGTTAAQAVEPVAEATVEESAVLADASEPEPAQATTAEENAEPTAEPAAESASAPTIEESAVLVDAPEPEAPQVEAKEPEVPATPAPSPEEILAQKRRKVELWNELKLVAFTRTLTTLYSIVLLSLQTHIQLNLVGRFNYLSSVTALAKSMSKDEDEWSPSGSGSSPAVPSFAQDEKNSEGSSDPNDLLRPVEQRYLTYSWWLLHRGALEIGTEVEAAVKHVLGTIPLKAELSLAELHRLVREVRRIVEWERVEGGGGDNKDEGMMVLSAGQLSDVSTARTKKRRRHFLSAMFPATEEGEREILAQAGVPTDPESELDYLKPAPSTSASFRDAHFEAVAEREYDRLCAEARAQRAREDEQLSALVNESKDWIDSDDFERVLALTLERVFGIWEANLAEGAFGGSAILSGEGADEVERERLMVELSRPRKVRLAALLPAVNAQSQLAIRSVPNEYAEALADVKELRALSALIYSSWST